MARKKNGRFGFEGGTAFLVTGGVQGDNRDDVEVVPPLGLVRSDGSGTEWRVGTPFGCGSAGGAMSLVRHL